MFSLSKPDLSSIESFLFENSAEEFTYDYVGATLTGSPPEDFIVDHNRVLLGRGEEVWKKAKNAIRNWKMFDFSWVKLHPQKMPIETGRVVAVLVSHLGFYSMNTARIVYTIDEPTRFGFADGTLPGHSESGEERFSVELDISTEEVWYDLYAFSQPNHMLAYVGYPFARYFQKQFAVDSKAAMINAIAH